MVRPIGKYLPHDRYRINRLTYEVAHLDAIVYEQSLKLSSRWMLRVIYVLLGIAWAVMWPLVGWLL